MVKKAVIEISLVKESAESANKKIMKEIFDGLSEDLQDSLDEVSGKGRGHGNLTAVFRIFGLYASIIG
jgi:hypothetical protein